MSQSPLVDYEAYTTTNCSAPRNQPISKITVHHMAGVLSVETMGNIIHNPNREVSCNYAIGSDGRIGAYIKEENRSWCSSSPWNDNRAITIETSNCATTSDWPVSDKVWNRLVELCADICKRNNIPKLTYTGNKEGTLTFHCFYAQTNCPGPYIKSRAQLLCDQVNAKLNNSSSSTKPATTDPTPIGTSTRINAGDWVKIKSGSTYWGGGSIPGWVMEDVWKVTEVSGKRAVLGQNDDGNSNINSPINVDCLINMTVATPESFEAYRKTLKKGTTIYKADLKTTAGFITVDGVYTITEEKKSGNTTYGKLKSGAGYVVVKGTAPDQIAVGDTVKVLKNIQYNGATFKLYQETYKVLQVNGDRVVISADGKNVTAAVNKNNLQKV